MKYLIFDAAGMPESAINDAAATELPENALEVNDQQFERWFDLRLIENNVVISEPAPPPAPSQNDLILAQIKSLEAQQTPRRIREAVLAVDGGWLADLNTQIADLRAQLS